MIFSNSRDKSKRQKVNYLVLVNLVLVVEFQLCIKLSDQDIISCKISPIRVTLFFVCYHNPFSGHPVNIVLKMIMVPKMIESQLVCSLNDPLLLALWGSNLGSLGEMIEPL